MMCLHPLRIANPKCDKKGFYLYNKFDEEMYKLKYGKEAYIDVPCGKCEACIERKANDWSSRIYYEWLYSTTSCFFTLTYADEFLKYDDVTLHLGSYSETHKLPLLCKDHVQKFMKRIRKALGNGVRFFLGGEYGEDTGRPHYHVVLFNYPDVESIYDIIAKCWSFGGIEVSEEMNVKRVMYVAKYIYSSSLLPNGNVIDNFQKPFILCSRRPGLGYQYFQDKQMRDYHNRELDTSVALDEGKRLGMPRYYRDKIFTADSKEELYRRWIDSPREKPRIEEVEIFLNRFKKKKRGKSI